MKNGQIVMVRKIFSSLILAAVLMLQVKAAPIDINTEYFSGKVGINKIIQGASPQLYVNGASATTVSGIFRGVSGQTAALTEWRTSSAAGAEGALLASIDASGAASFFGLKVTGGSPSDGLVLTATGTDGTAAWRSISAGTITSATLVGLTAVNGTVTSSDTVLSAIGKLAGNDSVQGGRLNVLESRFTGTKANSALSADNALSATTAASAVSFTGSLAGEVTGPQGNTVVTNAAVITKVLTGLNPVVGTVGVSDSILVGFNKIVGNTNANTSAISGLQAAVSSSGTVTNSTNVTGPSQPTITTLAGVTSIGTSGVNTSINGRLVLAPNATSAVPISTGGVITSNTSVIFIAPGGGPTNVTTSATTPIATPASPTTAAVGQILIIQGMMAANNSVTISNSGNVHLAAPITLSNESSLTLMWNGAKWVEISRSLNL